jgi:pyrroline-5-carboxylate reductase
MTDGAIHVGFIGLGHMGHGMVINILKRGLAAQPRSSLWRIRCSSWHLI